MTDLFQAFLPYLVILTWVIATAIDPRLGASSAFFGSKCDRKSTVRAFSVSFRRTSVSFRDTFGYVRARRIIPTYVISTQTY